MPVPVNDGDVVRENGTPYGPECKGCWVITASTKNKPQVVHQSDVNTELAPQDIYSGMYARVTINFFGYMNNGKKGVGCGLGNVMKTRDGPQGRLYSEGSGQNAITATHTAAMNAVATKSKTKCSAATSRKAPILTT